MSQICREGIAIAWGLCVVGCAMNDRDGRGRSTLAPASDPAHSPAESKQGSASGVFGVAKFSPMDLQTNVGTTPVMIELGGAQDLADQIAASTTLESAMPGGLQRAVIRMKTDVSAGATPTQTSVQVTPTTALAPGAWYVLTLSSVPSSLRIPVGSTYQRAEGTVAVRFRSDSFPILRRIRFCEKAPGTMRVLVDFSEPLAKPPAGVQKLFRVDQAGSTCADVAGSLDGSDLMSTYMIDCSGFNKDAPAVVTQAAPLAAKGGKALTTLDGGPLAVNVTASSLPIETEGDGCGHYVPTGL